MDEIQKRILALAAGNPGAIKVLKEIWASTYGDEERTMWLFDNLENASIKGPEIWVLYKDVSHEHVDWLIEYLTYRTPQQLLTMVMEYV